jgi:hypothetical protein
MRLRTIALPMLIILLITIAVLFVLGINIQSAGTTALIIVGIGQVIVAITLALISSIGAYGFLAILNKGTTKYLIKTYFTN